MRLEVHLGGRLGTGCVDEAEDLARLLIDPVVLVVVGVGVGVDEVIADPNLLEAAIEDVGAVSELELSGVLSCCSRGGQWMSQRIVPDGQPE